MRIGLFTDTYFPQVSGVATSIRTLKEELEKHGHDVYIFTTTDPEVKRYEDPTIIRLPSVPFISFTDRRVVYRGLISSYKIAKTYRLDIIHTQTEFSLGFLGKWIASALHIPVVHTYHTQYEDYVGYIAKGRLIKPSMVKYIIRGYLSDLDGVICPSRIVFNLLEDYHIKIPKRVIPTGIPIEEYVRKDITEEDRERLRRELGIAADETMLLSLSRVSSEKNIQAILKSLPDVLSQNPKVKLVVVGDGPYLNTLKALSHDLRLEHAIVFTGMIPHQQVAYYYKACDFFISASTSETQGLTYIESLASHRPIIAQSNPYLNDVIDHKMFGTLYDREEDLVAGILDAIDHTPEMTEDRYQKKLYEISAQHFAKSVYSFYLDVLISQENKKHRKLSLTMRKNGPKVNKTPYKLPKKVLKMTGSTSKKVKRVPKRMIMSIKDFLD
ncbi:glycosyltransferase family 4 protein [Streptococcus sciuri]|uniref:Glycosyltransferase family 4 protein n=1 Tax=Streptococcus sciuri TaxID=2973939 RepID=A0ABT2F7C4_9STRE|nr:glycosyltransferase family 4 protein [Streptococcus sciuri]MCS4488358.1 glycosyltransferase family 4 protein [Streptococcus sciuri]